MRKLAKINKRLNYIFSFPLLVAFFVITFETIVVVSILYYLIEITITTGLVCYLLFNCVLSVFLVYINQQVISKCRQCIRKMLIVSTKQQKSNSTKILIMEMQLYENDFQLRLFCLLPVNYHFILVQGLIILYNVVLLAQTGGKMAGY